MRTLRTADGQQRVVDALRAFFSEHGSPIGAFNIAYPNGRDAVQGGYYFEALDFWVSCLDITGSRWAHIFNVGNPAQSSASQQIAVEVNVPMTAVRHRIQGVALQDADGRMWIGHRGGLGGNFVSSGDAFRAWYPGVRATVNDNGTPAEVLLLGRIGDPDLLVQLRRFVDLVRQFKSGDRNVQAVQDTFQSEFTSEKSVRVEQDTRVVVGLHGRVVNALRDALTTFGLESFNDQHRDLYVRRLGQVLALFEVKTRAESTDCYTATGQLMLHGQDARHRILVAPEGPVAFESRLVAVNVHRLRYRLQGDLPEFPDLVQLLNELGMVHSK